jgi:hypothetical protein
MGWVDVIILGGCLRVRSATPAWAAGGRSTTRINECPATGTGGEAVKGGEKKQHPRRARDVRP